MNYISTRGAGIGERHVLRHPARRSREGRRKPAGRVSDGVRRQLARWRTLSYADLAFEILSKFCDDVPADDLRAITRRTYTADVCRNTRHGENASDITPLKTLGTENGAPISLLELSNGPTLAFRTWRCVARQPVRVRAREARAVAEHSRRDVRRHGQRGRIRDARQGRRARVHAVAAQEDERVPDGPDVQPAGSEHLQPRGRRRVRRLPGHREGRVERSRVQGAAEDRHGQLDQLGTCRRAGRVLLQGLLRGHPVE